jgi:hypothetical protein
LDLKANGHADCALAIRLWWKIKACVGALVGLGFFSVSADEILALFPMPPSGELASKGLTEAEVQVIERELGITVPPSHQQARPNWFEDKVYIMNSNKKLCLLYKLQGHLSVLCRQLEAAPSLAINLAMPTAALLALLAQAGQKLFTKPTWDRESLTLFVGSMVCRKFTKGKGNQITLLDAFEASGWQRLISNPFPHAERLAQTIKDFNRRLCDGSPFRLVLDHDRVGWEIRRRDGNLPPEPKSPPLTPGSSP